MSAMCFRVWSVAHSALQPNMTASGADDGVVRLWHDRALRGGHSTALLPAGGAAVCGVEFCGQDANLLAVACANTCSYVFDLRNRCRSVRAISSTAMLRLSHLFSRVYSPLDIATPCTASLVCGAGFPASLQRFKSFIRHRMDLTLLRHPVQLAAPV